MFKLFLLLTIFCGCRGEKLRFEPHQFFSSSGSSEEISVEVKIGEVINTVKPYFLSYCMDSYVFNNEIRWLNFNFSSPKLRTLLKELSPAFFRVGGYPSDYLFFDVPYEVLRASNFSNAAVVMTKEDVVNMVELTKATESRLLFDLNLQMRFHKTWDPTNAIKLMEFLKDNDYGENIDWELGNEPSYWAEGVATPEQLAKDYKLLSNLVSHYPLMKNSSIFGPDIITVDTSGLPYLEAVAKYSGSIVKAVTFHHYYLKGNGATYADYLNTSLLKNYEDVIDMVRNQMRKISHSNIPIWNGETSDGWNGGTPGISDKFVSGFLWLDKLGVSGRKGVGVVMRQTIYGHNYPLLDINMNPNPDYWLSWIHKKLVGQKVFDLNVDTKDRGVRIYSHCTQIGNYYKNPGGLTIFGLNMNQNKNYSIKFSSMLSKKPYHLYILEPYTNDPLCFDYHRNQWDYNFYGDYDYRYSASLSKCVKLNGKLLQMNGNEMPNLEPHVIEPSQNFLLPNLSFFFVVFHDTQISHCMS